VAVVLGLLTVLFLFMLVPRQRESARVVGGQQNLMQIGRALALYDVGGGHLPPVRLGDHGPLAMVLAELSVSDFRGLDPKRPPVKQPGWEIAERPVPGFVCSSDRHAVAGIHPAPVSYRATTGDTPDGRSGAFALDRSTTFAAIEAADGASYTALFSERLVGDNASGMRSSWNYALVGGPVVASECPDSPSSAWKGDAGSSWVRADWRSTLYSHALLPNAASSCVASDGRTALMGASSSHLQGVNVLIADLSVRTLTPHVDSKIWREWASITLPAVAAEPKPDR